MMVLVVIYLSVLVITTFTFVVGFKSGFSLKGGNWKDGSPWTGWDTFSFVTMLTLLWPIGFIILAVNAYKIRRDHDRSREDRE